VGRTRRPRFQAPGAYSPSGVVAADQSLGVQLDNIHNSSYGENVSTLPKAKQFPEAAVALSRCYVSPRRCDGFQ
jgi:hypothetical protein